MQLCIHTWISHSMHIQCMFMSVCDCLKSVKTVYMYALQQVVFVRHMARQWFTAMNTEGKRF